MPLTPAAPRPSKSRPVWDHSFTGTGFLRVSALGLYRVKADMMVVMGEIWGSTDISGDSCLIFLSSLQPPLPLPLCQNNNSETNKTRGGNQWISQRKSFSGFPSFSGAPQLQLCRNAGSEAPVACCRVHISQCSLQHVSLLLPPRLWQNLLLTVPAASHRYCEKKREESVVHGGLEF